jgi:hypothetical protein
MNCKPGDIAIITWDDEPVLSNVGKLVLVEGPLGNLFDYGPAWHITPLTTDDGYLFIDVLGTGEVVKLWRSGEEGIRHPDAWMRPLQNPHEEFHTTQSETSYDGECTSPEENAEAATEDA